MKIFLLLILTILILFVLGEKNLEEKKTYARCFIATVIVIGLIELIPLLQGV